MHRFWSKVDKTEACWLWMAAKHGPGYGRFKDAGFTWLAHRYAYILTHGHLPEHLTVDHLCNNPSCVRPDHLEAVTQAENARRQAGRPRKPRRPGVRGRKKPYTHCPQGHPYSGSNLYVRPSGVRDCRACNSARHSRQKGL